jgi:hypothetical protein
MGVFDIGDGILPVIPCQSFQFFSIYESSTSSTIIE